MARATSARSRACSSSSPGLRKRPCGGQLASGVGSDDWLRGLLRGSIHPLSARQAGMP